MYQWGKRAWVRAGRVGRGCIGGVRERGCELGGCVEGVSVG